MASAISQASVFFDSLPLDDAAALVKISSLIDPDNQQKEAEWIDYKNGKDKEPRNTWSKALSGFANSGGGILIWGIQTVSKDNYDIPQSISLADNPDELAGNMETWKSTTVDPPVRGVQIRSIKQADGKGFVVAYIPESSLKPHQARAERWGDRYYIRIGHQTLPATQSLLRTLFYPQFTPLLELSLLEESKSAGSGYIMRLRIRNTGTVTVSELFVVIHTHNEDLVFAANSDAFVIQAEGGRIVNLNGKAGIHPHQMVSIGSIRLFFDEVVLVSVFGKDMKPFMWKITGTIKPGHFTVTLVE